MASSTEYPTIQFFFLFSCFQNQGSNKAPLNFYYMKWLSHTMISDFCHRLVSVKCLFHILLKCCSMTLTMSSRNKCSQRTKVVKKDLILLIPSQSCSAQEQHRARPKGCTAPYYKSHLLLFCNPYPTIYRVNQLVHALLALHGVCPLPLCMHACML
jgi:hypothetical protein